MPRLNNASAVGWSLAPTGYRVLTGIYDHALSGSNGAVLEHRKVLYDNIGPGPHPCHWGCGRTLGWPEIFVDHLDDDKLNNVFENLAPSCFSCNIHRTRASRAVCPRGHRRSVENTYVAPKTGHRSCRVCKRERARSGQE